MQTIVLDFWTSTSTGPLRRARGRFVRSNLPLGEGPLLGRLGRNQVARWSQSLHIIKDAIRGNILDSEHELLQIVLVADLVNLPAKSLLRIKAKLAAAFPCRYCAQLRLKVLHCPIRICEERDQ